MPEPRFPQEVCPRGEDGECAFASRGRGFTCQTCGQHVSPIRDTDGSLMQPQDAHFDKLKCFQDWLKAQDLVKK